MATISYTVDGSEVIGYAGELTRAADVVMVELPPVVERGANNVKRDARRLFRAAASGTYLPHYPRAISYDMEQGADWVEAEIGPESGKPQGGMGRGVEFGSANTPPIPHLFPAFEAEAPKFVKQCLAAAARSLR